jgi:hypothetical protein
MRFPVMRISFGIDHIVAKGVQYRSLTVPGYPDRRKIVKVNMTVDQVSGFKGPHKPEESPETPVAGVFPVVYPFRSGVSQEYVQITPVKNPVKEQNGYFGKDFPEHFDVGKLVFSVVVLHGSPQPHDDKALLAANSGIHVNGAGKMAVLRKIVVHPPSSGITGVFLQIMIAENKEERLIQRRNDKFKVIHGKIPRAQNHIRVSKPFLYERRINEGINLI